MQVDLVGKGPLREALERQAARLGIGAICNFHGHVEPAELVRLLGEADVFVTPSLSDGNNVSLNEAMACGPFPIATRIPANVQWIDDGRNGFLYAPGSDSELAACLRRALQDDELRARARGINREIILTRASWDVCCRQMDELYEAVISRHGRRKS